MDSIFKPKNEEQRETLSVTMACFLLLQATADLADDREKAIELNMIDETMTHLQSLACLYARYIFMGYEKKYSPLIAASFMGFFAGRYEISHNTLATLCPSRL